MNKSDRFQSIPRLSNIEALILDLLIDGGEMYGLQLIDRSGARIKRGTIYVTLARMEEKGYVESRSEDRHPEAIGLPRRLYKPTGYGIKVLRAWEFVSATLVPEGVLP